MKVVPLSEAKAKLSRYAVLCRSEPIVITVNGRPSFQLVPLAGDDLIDSLLESHPGFRRLLKSRLSEKSISLAETERRLGAYRSSRAKDTRKPRTRSRRAKG